MLDLKQNVQYVKGIGPKRVKVLNSIGIYTLYDLITYFPRDYEDRTKTKKIQYTFYEIINLIETIYLLLFLLQIVLLLACFFLFQMKPNLHPCRNLKQIHSRKHKYHNSSYT